jgi:protein ImuA
LLRELRKRVQEIESARCPRAHAPISTGIAALDRLLPGGGVRAGTLVELISAADGAGAWTLGLVMARHACNDQRVLVVVDGHARFYPPAASRVGLKLDRLIVVRPTNARDEQATWNQSLRCGAVGAVLGGRERIGMTESRRLQLAAERGAGVGFLVRPRAALRAPSCAALRLLVTPVQSRQSHRRLQVEVVRCRGRECGQVLVLEIDDETGAVRVPARVAAAAAVAGPARASG